MKKYLILVPIVIVLTSIFYFLACSNKKTELPATAEVAQEQQQLTAEGEELIDRVDTIVAKQLPQEAQSLELNFGDMKVVFKNLALEQVPKTAKDSTILADTLSIVLGLGQSYEDLEFYCDARSWKNLVVEQQYETSIALYDYQNETHLDLRSWKHYVSPWERVVSKDNGTFKTLYHDEEHSTKFPKFSKKELSAHLQKINTDKVWTKMLEKSYKDEPPWGIAISEVRLRIKGQDATTGVAKQKIVCFKIPMG